MKTLYSLVLDDNVVKEVDALAHKLNTNRSSLINRILAEYVDYVTPERRINDIFTAIDRIMQPSPEFVPLFVPNSCSMSLKSSLRYKYRPTVKYEVELYPGEEEKIGMLSVMFRSQSPALVSAMAEFFGIWKATECKHLVPLTGCGITYELSDGKFTRSITRPEKDCTSSELATVISDYITLFDKLLKSYVAGECSIYDIESAYYSNMVINRIHI